MAENWIPPFYLYAAGVGATADRAYYNDVSQVELMPRRLLIKRTVSGCGTLYVEGRRYPVPVGSMFIIERPGPYIYCYEGDGEEWRFEYVSIAFASPAGIFPEKLRIEPVFALAEHDRLNEMLTELINLRRTPGYRVSLLDSAMAYRFFLAYVGIRTRQEREPHPVAEKMRQIILSKVSDSEFNLATHCTRLGYTKEAMIRIFHHSFGLPPGRFLQEQRLNLACELLRTGNLKIKEIAALTGFSSANYFSRLFRQRLKLTPQEYRDRPELLPPETLD
ncbi:MAG: AraC family transcriptional regulator [Victivallaceae bacterium]